MTRPIARVLTLLELLQAGGTRTVGDLAERLGVDERTVRRYVDHLLDLDVPVESVRGRYGGYRLAPGYRMPPLMLTDDEALVVVLGLATLSATGVAGGTAEGLAVESASAKVRRVLPTSLRARLDALVRTASVETSPRATPAADVLLLAQAALDRVPVTFAYTSREGSATTRALETYGLVAHAGHWYAAGRDSRSGEDRTFRVDRMRDLALDSTRDGNPRRGAFEPPDGFDATAAVIARFAGTPEMQLVSVRLRASADDLAARVPRIATVAPLSDDDESTPEQWCRLTLRAQRLDWVPALLAGLDREFVIETPDSLRAGVRSLGERLLAIAGPDDMVHDRPSNSRQEESRTRA